MKEETENKEVFCPMHGTKHPSDEECPTCVSQRRNLNHARRLLRDGRYRQRFVRR